MSKFRAPLGLLLAAALAACGGKDEAENENQSVLETKPAGQAGGAEPERVVVDHILIGVRSPAFPNGKYTPAEAHKLAYSLLDKLKNGADWAALKSEYSDDPPPGGPYGMANRGVVPRRGEHPRDGMVGAFGDVGFKLAVGEIAIADYTPNSRRSPFGYHIIKRIQ